MMRKRDVTRWQLAARLAAVLVIVGPSASAASRAPGASEKPPARAAPSEGSSASRPTALAAEEDSTAILSQEARVARAALHYDSGRYGECAEQFEVLLRQRVPEGLEDPELVERARVYRAACLLGLGKTEDADKELERAIRSNPQMGAPDALVFPQAVVDRFLRVREQLMDEIREAEQVRVREAEANATRAATRARAREQRIQELEYLASQEIIVREHSRWVAAVPFGAGQFQNGQEGLGWLFLGAEAAFGATAVGALVVDAALRARQEAEPALEADISDARATAYTVFVATSWAFLGVSALGIAQAQLSFVHETREVRHRPLPAHLRRRPEAAVLPAPWLSPSGGGLGVVGRF